MSTIKIKESHDKATGFALFNLAFRPFFSAGVLFAVLAMIFWALLWTGHLTWQPYGHPVWWHAHELLFGFAAAIIVGFLLTAVQTWTGVKAVHGWPLALLFSLWLFGRVLLFFPFFLNSFVISSVDMLFLFAAAGFMAYPVFKVKQKRNMAFPFVLLFFALLNGIGHYALINKDYALTMNSLHAAIMIVTLLITLIGGRVIPFFTANATDYQRKDNVLFIEILAIGSVVLLILLSLWGLSKTAFELLFSISMLGFISHSLRLLRWGGQYSLRNPLLWSLHLAYAFIPTGMLLLALWSLGMVSNLSAALHCFTVGAMAGMILAMISRVSLGHTGRPLKVAPLMAFAYLAISLSAVLRSFISLIWPQAFDMLVLSASFLWILAFTLFLLYYIPMLLKARVDGLPG